MQCLCAGDSHNAASGSGDPDGSHPDAQGMKNADPGAAWAAAEAAAAARAAAASAVASAAAGEATITSEGATEYTPPVMPAVEEVPLRFDVGACVVVRDEQHLLHRGRVVQQWYVRPARLHCARFGTVGTSPTQCPPFLPPCPRV